MAKTGKFEYQAQYQRVFLLYRIKVFDIKDLCWRHWKQLQYRVQYGAQCRVQCIVLTSDAYDRTWSCCALSRPPKPWQLFGWWTPNGWGLGWMILQIKSLYHLLHSNCTRYRILYIPHISLSHCYNNKRHSLTATAINDQITAIPNLFPRSRSFTTGESILTSLIRSPNHSALSTPACMRAADVTFFVAYTETELVWERSMDYILLRHKL